MSSTNVMPKNADPIGDVAKALDSVVGEITQYPEQDVKQHPILIHIANTLRAATDMLRKETGAEGTNLTQNQVSPGTDEQAAKGVQNLPEFAAAHGGDEDLAGLSKATKLVALAKKYPQVAETLNMARENPMLSKIITTPPKPEPAAKSPAAKPAAKKDKTAAKPSAPEAKNEEQPEAPPPVEAGFVRVQDSRGGIHDIPEQAIAAAQQRDPGLKIMGGK